LLAGKFLSCLRGSEHFAPVPVVLVNETGHINLLNSHTESVINHCSMNEERSWIITTEFNKFT